MSLNLYRSFAQEMPSVYVLLCWSLVVSILLLTVSGCGRYKEELKNSKQQIEKLNSEVKKLTEETARLNQEKSSLSDNLRSLSDKNAQMDRKLANLNESKLALAAENSDLNKKISLADGEIASLNREKKRLAQEVEDIKKRVAITTPQPTSPSTIPTRGGQVNTKQLEELSPCGAVLAFMKESEGIVRNQRGPERTKSLEQAHQQYAPRMKGAPEKAIKAAQDWVKEGTKYWDRSPEVELYRVLQLRNIALEACGKSPTESGFK